MICPYNFVKTKLKLETMSPGQVLVVHLDDGDPIRNVLGGAVTKATISSRRGKPNSPTVC